jgi:hypothetical protein
MITVVIVAARHTSSPLSKSELKERQRGGERTRRKLMLPSPSATSSSSEHWKKSDKRKTPTHRPLGGGGRGSLTGKGADGARREDGRQAAGRDAEHGVEGFEGRKEGRKEEERSKERSGEWKKKITFEARGRRRNRLPILQSF